MFTLEKKSYLLVVKLVNRDGHVSRLPWTRIHIVYTLRNKVHVMEDKALPRLFLKGLLEGGIHQYALVEGIVAELKQQDGFY